MEREQKGPKKRAESKRKNKGGDKQTKITSEKSKKSKSSNAPKLASKSINKTKDKENKLVQGHSSSGFVGEGQSESNFGSFRFFRESSVAQLIAKKASCTLSNQAISFLAGGLEFIASEILSEALRNSPENRINSKAIFRSLQDDPDLNEFVRSSIVLDDITHAGSHEVKMTGYQID